MPGPAWTSATPTLSRGPSKRGPRLGEDGGRTQNAGCTVPAPVSSERKQLLLFVKGGLRKKSEDVCLHPGFCLWNILEHQVPVTGDGREPSGWRERRESVSAVASSRALPEHSGGTPDHSLLDSPEQPGRPLSMCEAQPLVPLLGSSHQPILLLRGFPRPDSVLTLTLEGARGGRAQALGTPCLPWQRGQSRPLCTSG